MADGAGREKGSLRIVRCYKCGRRFGIDGEVLKRLRATLRGPRCEDCRAEARAFAARVIRAYYTFLTMQAQQKLESLTRPMA